MEKGDVANEKEPNMFDRAGSAVSKFFVRSFEKLGLFCGTRPWTTIGLALLFVIICGAGMMNFKVENRSEKLWVPTASEAQDDKKYVDENYFKYGRFEEVLLHAEPPVDVLQPVYLDFLWRIHNRVLQVEYEHTYNATTKQTIGWEDICLTRGSSCQLYSIFDAFNNNPANWQTEAAIKTAVNGPVATSTGEPFEVTTTIGGIERGADGLIVSAKAISLPYLISRKFEVFKSGDYEDTIADGWEQSFLDLLETYAENLDPELKAALPAAVHETIIVDYATTRSFADEFSNAIGADLSLLQIAILAILIYATVMLSKWGRGLAGMRLMLCIGGVACIGLSIVASFGIASAFGLFYSPLMSVLPFLLLGIGVDDMFVIVNAFDLTDPNDEIPIRLSKALGLSGTSVTVTSLTDFFAFAVGSQTSLPALRNFCLYAAIGIMVDFMLQVTLFCAFLVFDTRRMNSKKCDPCCCVGAPGYQGADSAAEKGQVEQVTQCGCCAMPMDDVNGQVEYTCCPGPFRRGVRGFLGENLGRALGKNAVKVGVIALFAVITAIGITGVALIEIDADVQDFIPPDNYLADWWVARKDYLTSVGESTSIYMQPQDYANPAVWGEMTAMYNAVKQDPYIANSTVVSWFEMFRSDVGTLRPGALFFQDVKAFLETGGGNSYRSDIVWNDAADPSKGIKTSKINANHIKVDKSNTKVKSMDSLRATVANVQGLGDHSFAYSEEYLTYEQYKSVADEIVMNISLALMACGIIIFLLVINPLASFIVFASVTSVVVNIVGYMHFWDLTIDSVTVIMLVIALGLAVDYSAHIGHSYVVKTGTANERIEKALTEMGPAVFHGAMSTFLAVMVLSGSISYVFITFFKQLFLCITLGLAHGLILLPVLLSLANPKPHDTH
eukprot:CAMPEP_0182899448 /NCGR_PEP_ID=MMETSP0034_2-20130328/28076_1 /TAXON_ID=156128 /ORGANISM="Nephroselmis pyriformis, Strain CCMP717" /LENGTH=896 /DNA_ID=CAMNT_0025033481 /DNA_START=90 /DNA_END=2780 /DNA_ORIENTATION=+